LLEHDVARSPPQQSLGTSAVQSPRDGKLVNQWTADHCHTLAGGHPILALDM